MGRKLGAVPLLGELGSHVTQSRLDRGPPPYQLKCHLDPSSRFATIDISRKLGALPLLEEGEARFSSNNVAMADRREAYMHAKFRLESFNR